MQFLFLSVFRKFPTFHIDSYFHFRKIIFSYRFNSFFQKKRFWLLTKANGQLLMRFGGGGGRGESDVYYFSSTLTILSFFFYEESKPCYITFSHETYSRLPWLS